MNKLKILLGTGFGSGLLPKAPGTWGSLAALLPAAYLHTVYGNMALIAFALAACGITLWVVPYLEEIWEHDSAKIVIDEWAGQSIALLALSPSFSAGEYPIWVFISFVLFRVFDISKTGFINRLQKLNAGWGVLLDDVLAGLYAFISIKILIFAFFF